MSLSYPTDTAGPAIPTVPVSYTTVKHGEREGVTSATQMPSVACQLVRFKALSTNSGIVYIGGAGVTVADGVEDATAGFPLSAGEDTGWIPCSGNLNNFYFICSDADQDFAYLALG